MQKVLEIFRISQTIDFRYSDWRNDLCITAELKDGYLTVSAAKGLDKDEEDKKGHYIRQERYSGAMSRTFYVGEDVKQEDIKAKFENGILSLSVPKPVEQKKVETSKRIAIEG